MKKSIIIAIAVVAVVVAGGLVYYDMSMQGLYQAPSADQANAPAPAVSQAVPEPSQETQTPVAAPAPSAPMTPVAPSPAAKPAPASVATPAPTPTPASTPAPAPTPTPKSFVVNGNDSNADLTSITVAKGTPVTITFGADAEGTYHGGLDFRSSVVSSGTIPPGGTKTVNFTAENSFAFTPYWPATNIAKPYTIKITVD